MEKTYLVAWWALIKSKYPRESFYFQRSYFWGRIKLLFGSNFLYDQLIYILKFWICPKSNCASDHRSRCFPINVVPLEFQGNKNFWYLWFFNDFNILKANVPILSGWERCGGVFRPARLRRVGCNAFDRGRCASILLESISLASIYLESICIEIVRIRLLIQGKSIKK